MVSEPKLSPAQYQKFAKIVYEASGIVLDEKKYSLLVARLGKRMRQINISSVADYIHLISHDQKEFAEFIDATTTNHTFFYRENKHCEYLIKTLDRKKSLKIWSAASSSGEEAFSIAVQLLSKSFSFNIYASDVSGSMLEKAQRGVYPNERVSNVPRSILHTYFQKGRGKLQNYVKVKPEVQKLVTFDKFNLLSDTPTDFFDIIFCRNVMIYFDNPTRRKVVNSLSGALKPGGYFFVGLAESIQGFDSSLTSVLPSGYKKKDV